MSPGSRRALLAVFALLAITGTVVVGTALAEQTTVHAQEGPAENAANETGTVIEISIGSDGDARWTITEHVDVSSPGDREVFEELAERFEDGRATQVGLSSFREARDRVVTTVDRSMEIQNVQRATSAENGTLALSFTWTNFAREEEETRIVDDAFTTDDGTWLNGIGPDESLVIELPRGSAIDTPKAVTDGTIRWDGPAEFDPGYLQISYTANPAPPIPTWVWGVGLALAVFAALGVVGGYLLSRRRGGISLPRVPFGRSETDGGTTVGEPDHDPPATAQPGEAADAKPEDEGVDLSLLSDEERVEYLIEQNGGRMKQANIVKETGWSNAKVSQLLSSMEDEGRIAKLRIGRENLISFPDEDIGEFEDT